MPNHNANKMPSKGKSRREKRHAGKSGARRGKKTKIIADYEFPPAFEKAYKKSIRQKKGRVEEINVDGISRELLLLVLMNYVNILGEKYSSIYEHEMKKIFKLKYPLEIYPSGSVYCDIKRAEYIVQNDNEINLFFPLKITNLPIYFFKKMIEHFHNPGSCFSGLIEFWAKSDQLLWNIVQRHWIENYSVLQPKEFSQSSLVFTQKNKMVYMAGCDVYTPKPQNIIIVGSDWTPLDPPDDKENWIQTIPSNEDQYAHSVVRILGVTPLSFQLVEHLISCRKSHNYWSDKLRDTNSAADALLEYFTKNQNLHKKYFPKVIRELIFEYAKMREIISENSEKSD